MLMDATRPEILPQGIVGGHARRGLHANGALIPLLQQGVHIAVWIPQQLEHHVHFGARTPIGIRLRIECTNVIVPPEPEIVVHRVEIDARQTVGRSVDIVIPADGRATIAPRLGNSFVLFLKWRIGILTAIVGEIRDQPGVQLDGGRRLGHVIVAKAPEVLIRVFGQHALNHAIAPVVIKVGEIPVPHVIPLLAHTGRAFRTQAEPAAVICPQRVGCRLWMHLEIGRDVLHRLSNGLRV